MRGEVSKQEAMFSDLSPEKRVPAEHPLRRIREMVDTVLTEMSPRLARRYADVGRPSIAPERLLRAGTQRSTLGGDKNDDTREWVRELRKIGVTPHVAPNNTNRSSALDGRTTRPPGYQISPQKRKRIEQRFGWMKIMGMLKKVQWRGRKKVSWLFTFVGAAYHLYRLGRLAAEAVA